MAFIRLGLVLSLLLTSCVSEGLRERKDTARAAAHSAASQPVERAPYRIGPGDSLRVEHRFNEELNRITVVRPDGFVTLPLVGEVSVADQTLPDARTLLEELYGTTVREVRVSVSLESSASYKIVVGGEVLNPGLFSLADGLTALKAIALAGGPRATARLTSVVILRDQGLPQPEFLLVNLQKAGSGLDGNADLRLRPKDMVFVPRSTIATMDTFVDQYINQLIPFSKNIGVTYLIGGKGFY